MTFDQLPLYEAIHDTYQLVDDPRSDRWLLDEEKKESLCRQVRDLLPFEMALEKRQILEAWSSYGKSSHVGKHKKLELLILVARIHGRRCFWARRGRGECSSTVSIDRLIPETRSGLYVVENCVIACQFHNTQRGNKTVEDYLKCPR